jgi:hypothetical protein
MNISAEIDKTAEGDAQYPGQRTDSSGEKEAIYDSEVCTRRHIDRIRFLLAKCASVLLERGIQHDASKLEPAEKAAFDGMGNRHLEVTYGSEEYMTSLAGLKTALDHHYAHNPHHPEHYPNGINGMSLFDLVEMLMDWKATAEGHVGGADIERCLEIARKRFGISDQLIQILANTAKELGWMS